MNTDSPKRDVEQPKIGRYPRKPQIWQRVVLAERAFLRGEGWWRIELSCGHTVMVLHGPNNPLGERCQCRYRCGEAPKTDESSSLFLE